jgi:hypothetical protein
MTRDGCGGTGWVARISESASMERGGKVTSKCPGCHDCTPSAVDNLRKGAEPVARPPRGEV